MCLVSGDSVVGGQVRDFSLGSNCPVVGGVNVQKVELGEGDELEVCGQCVCVCQCVCLCVCVCVYVFEGEG